MREYKVKMIYLHISMDSWDAKAEFKRLAEIGWDLFAVIVNPISNCRELYYLRPKKTEE